MASFGQALAAGVGGAGEDIGKGDIANQQFQLTKQVAQHSMSVEDIKNQIAQTQAQTEQQRVGQEGQYQTGQLDLLRQQLAREGYQDLGAVKDPTSGQYTRFGYNNVTGQTKQYSYPKDFVPPDSYEAKLANYKQLVSQKDEKGNPLFDRDTARSTAFGVTPNDNIMSQLARVPEIAAQVYPNSPAMQKTYSDKLRQELVLRSGYATLQNGPLGMMQLFGGGFGLPGQGGGTLPGGGGGAPPVLGTPGSPNGSSAPTADPDVPIAQQAFESGLKNVPTFIAPIVRNILNYDSQKPTMSRYNPTNYMINQWVDILDPYHDDTIFPARAKAIKDFNASATDGPIGAINTALGHVGELDKARQLIAGNDPNNFPAMQALATSVGATLGSDLPSTYNLIVKRVAPEIAAAYVKGGGGEGERAADASDFALSKGDAQLRSNIAETANLLNSKLDAQRLAWNKSFQPRGPQEQFESRFLTPRAMETLNNLSAQSPTNQPNTQAAPAAPPGYTLKSGSKGYGYYAPGTN